MLFYIVWSREDSEKVTFERSPEGSKGSSYVEMGVGVVFRTGKQ